MTVLMVDDEPLTIQTLAKNIDWAHLGVSTPLLAFNAKQAKELFDANDKIDIILCDIEMPGTDGFSLLQWVREHHSETKMVIITNHAVFRYAQQAVHLGCVDYLTKPLNPEAVSETLRAIIKEKTDRLVSLAENETAKRNALWHDMLSNRFSNTAASFPAEKFAGYLFIPCLFNVYSHASLKPQAIVDLRFQVKKELADKTKRDPCVILFPWQTGQVVMIRALTDFTPESCKTHLALLETLAQEVSARYGCSYLIAEPLAFPTVLDEAKNMYQFSSDFPCYSSAHYNSETEHAYRVQREPVVEAKKFIERYFDSDISRNQVSEYVHLHPDYLDRLFKAELNMSVAHFIREKKIAKAQKQLRTTSMSISEIAFQEGYTNLSNFTEAFKRITGMTPQEYRKKNT